MADHLKLVERINRLRAAARAKGDRHAEEALDQCLIHSTGGNLLCPIGVLLMQDLLKTGTPPGAAISEDPEIVHGDQPADIPETHEVWLQNVLRPVFLEAMDADDQDLMQAVRMCSRMSAESPSCPIYRFLEAKKRAR